MNHIKDELYWVGIKDWELESFEGHHYSTRRGATYNSYLIKDEKTALVDVVFEPFAAEHLSHLAKHVGLENIDYVIINHSEIDHAGSLASLMAEIPEVPIYCSKKCSEFLKQQHHQEWNFHIVKTGDTLNLGRNTLTFIESPMLHWPDSMMTYVAGMNVLLSSDAFGQHYTTSQFFNDEVDTCILYQEALKYYANILTPFSRLVAPKIKQLLGMNLPIEMIAPGHGLIWRENPNQIIEQYIKWADSYNEGHVLVLYDTMWGNTEKMAHSIAGGLAEAGVPYRMFSASNLDISDLTVETFIAKGLLIGSSTVNNGMLPEIIALLDTFRGMKFCGKKAAAFGSYGWSGEAPKLMDAMLKSGRFEVTVEPLKIMFTPGKEDLEKCHQFGLEFGKKLN